MKRVHFVCVGNCCRSQMAEAFARHWGNGFVFATSSGLAPTREVAWQTVATMEDRGIDIKAQFPKKFDRFGTGEFDLIVNLSGFYLPGQPVPPVEEWQVGDPYGKSAAVYSKCADDIESRVKTLIEQQRQATGPLIAPSSER